MRIIALIFSLFALSLNAQTTQRADHDQDLAMVDTKAPLGLDLMYGKKEGVTVFPNAANDHILISVAGKPSEKKSIKIYNGSGQPVFGTGTVHENTYLVDVSGLRKDLYFIEVSSGGQVYRKKWYRS